MAEKSWSVSDKFWEKVEPLIPKVKRDKTKAYQRRKGGGRKPMDSRKIMSCGREFNGRRSPKNMAVPAAFIAIFRNGLRKDFSKNSGKKVLHNMMIWKE